MQTQTANQTRRFYTTIIKVLSIVLFLGISINADAQYRQVKNSYDVETYADETANSLMKKISKFTGKSSQAIVDKSYYYEFDSSYEIHLRAYWTASVCWFCDTKKFRVDGVLTVNRNGRFNFEKTYQNSAVSDAVGLYALYEGAMLTKEIVDELNKEN